MWHCSTINSLHKPPLSGLGNFCTDGDLLYQLSHYIISNVTHWCAGIKQDTDKGDLSGHAIACYSSANRQGVA